MAPHIDAAFSAATFIVLSTVFGDPAAGRRGFDFDHHHQKGFDDDFGILLVLTIWRTDFGYQSRGRADSNDAILSMVGVDARLASL
jgi:hypothetical protein